MSATRDLSVAAEPARDDVANALQMLYDKGSENIHGGYRMNRRDHLAIVARLRSALAKLDAEGK